jgi:hypothetical protein
MPCINDHTCLTLLRPGRSVPNDRLRAEIVNCRASDCSQNTNNQPSFDGNEIRSCLRSVPENSNDASNLLLSCSCYLYGCPCGYTYQKARALSDNCRRPDVSPECPETKSGSEPRKSIRERALELAISAQIHPMDTDMIVERAEKFYAFLKKADD